MMNKHFALFAVVALLMFSGCNNPAKQNQESNSDEITTNAEDKVFDEDQASKPDESPAGNEESTARTSNSTTNKDSLKFERMIANTAGTSFDFRDESGNRLRLFPDNETEGMEFAYGLQPGDTNHKYNGVWYLVTYQKRRVETPGGPLDRNFVLKAEPVDESANAKEDKWDSELLKKVNFTGVEPYWSLELKETHAEFTEMGQETRRIGYEPIVPGITPTLSDFTRHNNQDVLQIPGTIDEIAFASIEIKKESCSDGMSDNNYDFAVKIEFKDGSEFQGCGDKGE